MKVILADDVNLASCAGRKIWIMGFTPNHTRILNPVEVFLYVERFIDQSRERLTLVKISESGDIIPVFDIDPTVGEDGDEDDGTILFIANSEDDIFRIPEVVQIQDLFIGLTVEALRYRSKQGLGQESLLFEVDTAWKAAK